MAVVVTKTSVPQSTRDTAQTGSLTTITIFCGLGLLASLLVALSHGLDLSSGFF